MLVLILGYASIFTFSRILENNKPDTDENFTDEDLYFPAQQLSLLGADFRGLIADWYWIKSLQYLGDKVVRHQETTATTIDVNDLRPLNPRLVYPMLDTAATLDPQFMSIYSYGAAVLPAIDNDQAIRLLDKGIAANPDDWRLYHNLGYIYWRAGNYSKAAEIYGAGATKKDAPVWMRQMSANMCAQGGSRDFARQTYRQMFETAQDEQTKTFAELRYAQIESLDQRDRIRGVLQTFQQKNNRCIKNWREVFPQLAAFKTDGKTPLDFDRNDAPVDPTGIAYLIAGENGECDVELDLRFSKIPAG